MKYHYTGPASGVTLSNGTEILLWPHQCVDLPQQHEYVDTLKALGYLQPVPIKQADTLPKRPSTGKTEK